MRSLAAFLLMASTACSASGTSDPLDSGTQPQDAPVEETEGTPFAIEPMGAFDEPWAADFMPGTDILFVTEKAGTIKFEDVANGRFGTVESGVPSVSYGGQGGLGDIAFAPDFEQNAPGNLYLTWVEAGEGKTRGAVLGRGTLVCEQADSCELRDLAVIWRQDKVTGGGHFSHRIAFSPDGQYIFLTSGERQKGDPAQELDTNLGKVLRLTRDGKAAPGNPWAEKGGVAAQFWSIGHRNLLGIEFAPDGRLWEIEMGPKGGDELNLVEEGGNYGWPDASMGVNYNGTPIPDHKPGDGFVAPVAWWVPSISPGSFLIYDGDLFEGWKGDALLAGLSGQTIARVDLDGAKAVGKARYDMGERIREIVEGRDGALYALEDGESGRLLKLTPKK